MIGRAASTKWRSGLAADPDWTLRCSACDETTAPVGLPTVCGRCGQPWLVRYPSRAHTLADRDALRQARGSNSAPEADGMWGFRAFLPLADGESPITLGEGGTPLLRLARTGERLGLARLRLKDESVNPTGSFKARGLAMAVTRARLGGAESFVVPTAGNAGVALAAYAARAGCHATIFAPASTPPVILAQVRRFGAELNLLDGHIGDCGRAALAHAERTGAFPVHTLREPYRIEGKKTLGLELAEQLGWGLPDAVVYPAGGGTGLIGMWLAFAELIAAGWVRGPMPRMYAVQAEGCAPVVRAFERGAAQCEPWPDPRTVASGLRVPAPLGGALMLRAMCESGGGAVAVSDAELAAQADQVSAREGVDVGPEGGASLAGAAALRARGDIEPDETVIAFNTGAGWLYRS
ncbi:MAG TPA: threonine synthase [Gemmatimonadales bacterium]|nr:threonine synthase [Gemmatimonadales bacterium]